MGGYLVKLNNVIQAVIAGILIMPHFDHGDNITCVLFVLKLQTLPLVFNAILVINAELADPFDGSVSNFPKERYIGAVVVDGCKMVESAVNLPPWLEEKRERRLLMEESPSSTPATTPAPELAHDEDLGDI